MAETTPTDRELRALRAYYRKKIKLVQALEEKWREISTASPIVALNGIPATEEKIRELEELDQPYIDRFGASALSDALRNLAADSAPLLAEREKLRASLLKAADALMLAKSRLEDLKKDLGRRLSNLKSRSKLTRPGRFDRRA